MIDIQKAKQRFGIIGSSPSLNRAIETAIQVAPTDLSVLITGESGTGKEAMPQIIHQFSVRKHGPYIAVNCGAIPDGTIDSELFGHEKGSFTGASGERKGYFEVANQGTIFLDEVAELPMQTQVRLLRVLETGEFMKVGSSKVQKTDVRIVAATNVNVTLAISKNKFREDLFYRLNTVPIQIPALRERKTDIYLLFRKFASDFAEKYRMPSIRLDEAAQHVLSSHRWPGNIRQLKNITEQISIIEQDRNVSSDILIKYLPTYNENKLPVLFSENNEESNVTDRELLYKVLFDMKKDMTDLKKLVAEVIKNGGEIDLGGDNARIVQKLYDDESLSVSHDTTLHIPTSPSADGETVVMPSSYGNTDYHQPSEIIEESLSLEDQEIELIKKALEKYRGKRKYAAKELGISERTLYRKIKEYNLS